MARKANIAREEIHQACWELIEKNTFPNIPRLTEHFALKDGRRCSNTTFMNAIAGWEDAYKEHQQHQLQELSDILLPIFKRFSRDVTQNLGQLLDEKSTDLEQHQIRKQEATEGGFLSLSSALIELQETHDALTIEHKKKCSHSEDLQKKLAFSDQRYQDVLSHNHVLNSQLKQEQNSNTELRINLSQKEVDLAKQDNQLTLLKQENTKLVAELKNKQIKHVKGEAERWLEITKKLDTLTSSIETINHKDRGSKK
jgi:hypothetical protein